MLTESEMEDALFARICDQDPDYQSGEAAAVALANVVYNPATNRVDTEATKEQKEKSRAAYKRGKRVLDAYALRYAYRSTVHTMASGKIPGEGEGNGGEVRVPAGFVGAMQAYETAIFTTR